MRFSLVDRITQLKPGESIQAIKNLSLAEEYLADHFPGFPVMPGVLMLEAMTQASAWLIRATDDFSQSVVVLKEARNVKYSNFVKPAETLTVEASIQSRDGNITKLKASGLMNGQQTVSARLVMEGRSLSEEDANRSGTDEVILRSLRELFRVLWDPNSSNRTNEG